MTERATLQWAQPALLSVILSASGSLCVTGLVATSLAATGFAARGAAPAASVPAPAEKSKAAVLAEIQFARGLATDWSFVDLAEAVLRKVETDGVPREMSDKFELVKCDIVSEAAAHEPDPDRRIELFERALDAYGSFLAKNGYSSERANANSAYVNTAKNLSYSLYLKLEDALGEEAEQLRQRRQEVIEGALGKANEEISSLSSVPKSERPQADTARLYVLYLNKGKMLSDLAELFNSSGSNGSTFYDDAIGALEELVFEAGEGTPPAMHSYIQMGEVYLRRGLPMEAAAFLSAVIQGTIPVDLQKWRDLVKERELTDADKALYFSFLQYATGPLMKAYAALDDMQSMTEYALHFYNTQRREGFSLDPEGYESLLEVARAFLDSGGYVGGNLTQGEGQWFATAEAMADAGFKTSRVTTDTTDLALRIAQTVNQENKGRSLQVRAQKLIAEIITRPGVVVSPEVLFEAAQGQYYDDSFYPALEAYQRVLRAIEGQDQATRIAFGARVMNGIGNCYRKLDVPMLAAMAFREGCTTWLGDIEFDSKNANGYYKMMQLVERGAALEKDILTQMLAEAQRIVAESSSGSNGDEVRFNMGKAAQRKHDWQGAINEYNRIEEGSDWWEKGVVEKSVCHFRAGDERAALSGFDEYLEDFLKDTKRSATESPIRLAKRREASATAEFYRGFIVFTGMTSDDDAAGCARVIELLDGYWRRYPEQPALAAWTMNMVVQSQLRLNEIKKARAVMDELTKLYPDEKRTGEAALIFYNTLLRKQKDSNDPAEQATLLREMAEHLELGNSVGEPKFQNLQNEAKHWFDLAEWAKSEGVIKRILRNFGEDKESEPTIRTILKPRLGVALLNQRHMAEAKEVLTPLVMDEANPAPKSTTLAWIESVIGIVDGHASKVEVFPGAGGSDEEFDLITDRLNAYANAGDSWVSCDWYALKYQLIYSYLVWGQKDGRKLDSAKAQMKTIIGETTLSFDAIDKTCTPAEGASEELIARYGNGALKNIFKWLNKELN